MFKRGSSVDEPVGSSVARAEARQLRLIRLGEGAPETITGERGPHPSDVHFRRKFFLTREYRFSLNDLGNATVEAMQRLTHQSRSIQLPLGIG